ncbi:MAG: ion transporter [Magnetococcales bacterium]|nr:ion transporter [Magnetococcales bacterium]
MTLPLFSLPENRYFQHFIIGVILFNAAILGLLTQPNLSPDAITLLNTLDDACLVVFIFEITLKLIANRLRFFGDGWNVFDFIVVGIALVPGTGSLSVLRAFRVFRLMRLVNSIPSMRRVMAGMFAALPGTASVAGVLLVMLYVSAIMAVNFFGQVDPDNFGDLGVTFFTLFQFLTMEGWPDVARPIVEKMPYSWMFFIPFILLTTFTTLNLLFGIIVESMEQAKQEEVRDAMAEQGMESSNESEEMRLVLIEQEIRQIREKISALTNRMDGI